MDDPLSPYDDDRRPVAIPSAIVLLVPGTAVSLIALLAMFGLVTSHLVDTLWFRWIANIACFATPLAFALLVLRRSINRTARRPSV